MTTYKLMTEIEKWSNTYHFSFQFWGPDNNNCFIEKDGIEVKSFGGCGKIKGALETCLEWIKKENPSGYKAKDPVINHCQGCGSRIAVGNDFCRECLCEDDSDYL